MTDAMVEYRFDRFVVEPDRRGLLIDGEPARIGARAFDILLVLIKRRAQVVSKNELLDLIWPGTAVEPGNLQVHIFALRKLMGAGVIATVPGRGYQFTSVIEGQQPAISDEHHPLSSTQALPGNLPSYLATLYGRDLDLAKLATLIAQHRLVSIVGPGGIGKTRLAQVVARERRGIDGDGAWLVELAQVEKPELIVPTIARILGHTLGSNAVSSLVDALNQQELLLVLDNCEHLIEPVAELVGLVLAKAPKVKLLVTSQEPLHLDEEQVYRLESLAVPLEADAATALDHGAVALFVARAHASDGRFELDEERVGAVVEICKGLDGVPLALELAAARVSLLGVDGVRQRLNERLRLLSGGSRKALPRHRTLSAALQWSYGLLSDDERHVLDQLGIFVGTFPLEAARHFLANDRMDEWMALEHLSTLVDKSLLMVEPSKRPRYRLLETTRDFAVKRLIAAGTLNQTRQKHAQALIAFLRSRDYRTSPRERAASIAPDLANLRSAVAWATGSQGDRRLAVELAAELSGIWQLLGLNGEGADLFKMVEPWIDDSFDDAIRAKFWLSRAKVFPTVARVAADYALRAADIFRTLGDEEEVFDATMNAAAQLYYSGDFSAAESILAKVRARVGPEWPLWKHVAVEVGFGALKYWAGELSEAQLSLRLAAEMSRTNGDASQTELIEMMLVGCDVALRNSDEAIRNGQGFLFRTKGPIQSFNLVVVETFLCAALMQRGEIAVAEAKLRAALPRVKQALGSVRTFLCYLAHLCALQERYVEGAHLLGAIEGLRSPGAAILGPPNRASLEDAESIVVKVLGIEAVEVLKKEGRSLSENQAIALGFSRC